MPRSSALLERARTGDPAAFADLVRMHDGRLRRLAARLLARDDRVDDVLQEAYVRAYRSLGSFRHDAGIGTWLYRITYNCCIDELRAARRRPEPVESVGDRTSTVPEPGRRLEAREVVRRALAGLSEDQRIAVVLVDGEGFDYDDAASVLGVPRGTVASRVNRGRLRLRAALADEKELLR